MYYAQVLLDKEEDTFGQVIELLNFVSNRYNFLQGSVCLILQVIPSIPSCKIIEETCERIFTMHFDYCTTASSDFVLLDESAFSNILQVGSNFDDPSFIFFMFKKDVG